MAKGKAGDHGILRCTELISSSVFGLMVFVFFAFFYKYHLLFTEQLQLFLLTWDHFIEKLSLPGGFNGWTGGFLTQFYYIPIAGALIITLLIIAVQLLTNSVLDRFTDSKNLFPVNFIPAFLSVFILCNELYPLSAVTGFALALAAANIYTGIRNGKYRFAAGIILISGTWYLAGGAYITLVLILIMYELIAVKHPVKRLAVKRLAVTKHSVSKLTETKHNSIKLKGTDQTVAKKPVSGTPEILPTDILKIWHCLIYIFLAVSIPLIFRQIIIFQPALKSFFSEFYHKIPDKIPLIIPLMFILPVLLILISYLISERFFKNRFSAALRVLALTAVVYYGSVKWVDSDAEEIMAYDYYARTSQWDALMSFAEKNPPQNFLSLAMLNLSLAEKGQLAEKMFFYDQHGTDGLFLGFRREFISPLMGNEIFYNLGLINASQQYVFESMEVMPDMEKSVRVLKRLAETNLINGNYKVSEKYLGLVGKTLFHRKWARETGKFLYNEEMIRGDPVYGEKRLLLVKEDFFFHIEDIGSVLHRLLKENPGNKNVLEYLAAYYLLNREMEAFVNLLPAMEYINYRELPVSWQEAFILYNLVTNTDPLAGSFYRISRNIRSRMEAYAKVYLGTADAQKMLSQFYSDTYWYYFHYVK